MTATTPTGADAVDTVVFDLGGVLIAWDPRRLYRTFGLDDSQVDAILSELDFMAWNHRLDEGADVDEAVAELSARFPQHAVLIAAYPARFEETLVGPIEGTVAILAELAERGVRLLALTNWSAATFPHARRLYGFLQRFESILVSGEEGVAKPDPAIFDLLIDRHTLDPARTLFVDDVPANVAAATGAGLRALRFVSPAQLSQELRSLGLLAQPRGQAATV